MGKKKKVLGWPKKFVWVLNVQKILNELFDQPNRRKVIAMGQGEPLKR